MVGPTGDSVLAVLRECGWMGGWKRKYMNACKSKLLLNVLKRMLNLTHPHTCLYTFLPNIDALPPILIRY